MKSAFVLADRYSDAALKLLVSINVLFFLSFTIVLLIATGQARAETPACTGRSVMEELAAGKPAELARIEAEAAKVINATGCFGRSRRKASNPPICSAPCI